MALVDSIRQRVIDDVLKALVAVDMIAGVTDMRPTDYANPPRPEPGCGDPRLPFAWAYEGTEGTAESSTERVDSAMLLTIDVAFRYGRGPLESVERKGRELLAAVQTGMQANRKRNGLAVDTLEGENQILEAIAPHVGVVSSVWVIMYQRDRQDPLAQVTA